MPSTTNNSTGLTDNIVRSIIEKCGYIISKTQTEDSREEIKKSYDDLNLSNLSKDFLEGREIFSLWNHQYLALKAAKEGKNICVTTSTSSGKSEIFILSALEILAKSPDAKILAVYPMKALNRQQVIRWQKAYDSVGKIDGDTPMNERVDILQNKRVVVMTPDVIHAWLLNRLNDSKIKDAIANFISNISLIVVDELHLYKGLFGTNSAYLFRRLNNVRRLLRKKDDLAQYITASATLPGACEHSFNITGAQDFIEIGLDVDGSPMSEKTFFFIKPFDPSVVPNLGVLIGEFAQIDEAKTITFTESRQKTGRLGNYLDKNGTDGIYTYRSGYEAKEADAIARAMEEGNFKGVISTSALEIGIDIDGLDVAIIADMPYDKNSYQQRIGRVGRGQCKRSYVIVVNDDNSFSSELLFEVFDCDIDKVLPNYEPALYLEDKNVQSIQALTHVGYDDCEYKQWKRPGAMHQAFSGKELFPESFGILCDNVLKGQGDEIYQRYEMRCDNPHLAYTLRRFDEQYTIKPTVDSRNVPEEQISRQQVATEGYPKAIRYTVHDGQQTKERIKSVDTRERVVYASQTNSPTSTTPKQRSYVIPNFNLDQRMGTIEFGSCIVFNLQLKEHHTIYGYYEISGTSQEYHPYDLNKRLYLPALNTTGTVIFHPAFNKKNVDVGDIATILSEVFLRFRAFDRTDISHIGGYLFDDFEKGLLHARDKFVALYDTNELNITKKLLDENLLKELMIYIKEHMDVITSTLCPLSVDTRAALMELCDTIIEETAQTEEITVGQKKVIKLGSKMQYHFPDGEETAECRFVGKGNQEDTCNIVRLDTGEYLSDVPMDCLEPTSETEYITE